MRGRGPEKSPFSMWFPVELLEEMAKEIDGATVTTRSQLVTLAVSEKLKIPRPVRLASRTRNYKNQTRNFYRTRATGEPSRKKQVSLTIPKSLLDAVKAEVDFFFYHGAPQFVLIAVCQWLDQRARATK
jgi:hypothetical protein